MFDDSTIAAILNETGLTLAEGRTSCWLQRHLEDVAQDHYWREAAGCEVQRGNAAFSFDAVADPSVTPSRLRKRLCQIMRSSKRVFAGTSRRPQTEKAIELLERLGRDVHGLALKHSGTETEGHGGSERSAVWLCLIRAIHATEAPPRGFRSNPKARPWASQRLERTIQTLADFAQLPQPDQQSAEDAARALHCWAAWSLQHVKELLATTMARYKGQLGLNTTLQALATVYEQAFDRSPSLYRSARGGTTPQLNPWERFLQATLERILGPAALPSPSELESRWHRLLYGKR